MEEKKVLSRLNRERSSIMLSFLVPEPLSFRRECRQCISYLETSDTARRINNVTNLETIELTGGTDCICAHVIKPKPVSNLERARQFNLGGNTIYRVTGRPP